MSEGSLKELLKTGGSQRRFMEVDAVSANDNEYTAFSCGRVGAKSLLMVCFVKADGHHLVLQYADLHSIASGNPNKGFTLEFAGREIVIEGEHLGDCFRYLQNHRLAEIVELERPSAFMQPDGQAVVHKLTIRKAKAAPNGAAGV